MVSSSATTDLSGTLGNSLGNRPVSGSSMVISYTILSGLALTKHGPSCCKCQFGSATTVSAATLSLHSRSTVLMPAFSNAAAARFSKSGSGLSVTT